MPINPEYNKKIHHITHYSNLAKIIQVDHLYSGNALAERGIAPTNIGHMTLKQYRAQRSIDVHSEKTLNDCVPFFFTTRPPMLIAISRGSVADDYGGPQREIIYLVSSIEKIVDSHCQWCFTDGHAVEQLTHYYDDLENLREINWAVIEDWDFRPTADIPDKQRRKQAEFLVYDSVPWSCIESVTVMDRDMQTSVQEIILSSHSSHRPNVYINRNWYHNPRRH
jgi:hypothetical protein